MEKVSKVLDHVNWIYAFIRILISRENVKCYIPSVHITGIKCAISSDINLLNTIHSELSQFILHPSQQRYYPGISFTFLFSHNRYVNSKELNNQPESLPKKISSQQTCYLNLPTPLMSRTSNYMNKSEKSS